MLDEAAFATMAELSDFDLDASAVGFLGERPVGIAALGVRGDRAWVGGVGVVPSERRRGHGRTLMNALLGAARERGVETVTLEVLEQNEGARLLYEELGFVRTRDLGVWTLESQVAQSHKVSELGVDEAHATIRELRTGPEPWQRSDETLARLSGVAGLATDGGAALYRVTGPRVGVVQIGARDEEAARALLGALRERGEHVGVLNLPESGPVAAALRSLGARLDARQHELSLPV